MRSGTKYTVKYDGSVWSDYRGGRRLKAGLGGNGYLTVSYHGTTTKSVHVLVAEKYIPNPLGLPTVNHMDGDKTNNRVDNLEWASYAGNNKHAVDTGLRVNTSPNAKLDGPARHKARSLAGTVTQKDIAHELGVHPSTISNLLRGVHYGNITQRL